jgi:hypothetical protein
MCGAPRASGRAMGGEAQRIKCCSQELAALVEHGLFDQLVRLYQDGLWDREAKNFRHLGVDDQFRSLIGCSTSKV